MKNEHPMKLAHPRPIRIYEEDDAAFRKLHLELGTTYDVDIVQLIRDAVSLGRPLLERKFKK